MANTPKDWDRLPATTSDTDENTLYLAVGRALTEWEKVEEQLWVLYRAFLDLTTQPSIMEKGYRSSLQFDQRKTKLEDAAELYFTHHPDSQLRALFEEALTYAERFVSRRNDIAHGMVMSLKENDGRVTFLLYPPFHSPPAKVTRSNAAYTFNSTIIDRYIIGFEATYRKVYEVVFQVSQKRS
jgi:hypothetical protein